MAGLLDFPMMSDAPTGLLALSPQEKSQAKNLALLALAGGMIRGDFGGGLLGAGQAYQSSQENATKQKLLGLQAENLQSEVQARNATLQRQAEIQRLLNGTFGGSPAPAQQGQLGSGSFGILPPPQGQPSIPQGQEQGSSRIGSMSPDMLAMLKANGLDLVDVAKLARPDMQVSNGYAYDKNSLKPGFLPQLTIARNGQAALTQIGPDGMPVITAPTGAYNTYAGYRNIDESAKANFEPITVTPQGQNPQMTTRGALVRNPQVSGSPRAEADRVAILQNELGQATSRLQQLKSDPRSTPDLIRRAQADVDGLNKELGTKASIGLPLQSPAEQAGQVKQAEADVQPMAQRKNDIANANYMMSVIDMALNHPGLPTATGLSGTLDPRNYLPGTNAQAFKAIRDQIQGQTFLQAYNTLKGGGQITEIEGAKAQNAIARLNTAQSTEDFTKALTDLRQVVSNGLDRVKGNAASAGVPSSFAGDNSNMAAPLPKPMVGMVRNGYRFKGGNPADPNSWEKQ